MPPIRLTIGRTPAQVRHPILTVDVSGVHGLLDQRAGRTAGNRDVRAVGNIEHLQGVADDVIHADVAGTTSDRAQVRTRV